MLVTIGSIFKLLILSNQEPKTQRLFIINNKKSSKSSWLRSRNQQMFAFFTLKLLKGLIDWENSLGFISFDRLG